MPSASLLPFSRTDIPSGARANRWFSVGALTGTALLVITLAACGGSSPSHGMAPNGIDTLSLAVGNVARLMDPAQFPNITVTNNGTSGQYLVVVANADTNQDVTQTVDVSATDAELVSGTAVGRPTVKALGIGGMQSLSYNPGQIAFESKLHAFTRNHLKFPMGGFHTYGAPAPRNARASVRCTPSSEHEGVCPTPVSPVPSNVTVGSFVTLHVPTGPDNLCTQYVTTQAKVQAVSQHAIIVEDTLDESAGATFTSTAFDSIASEFDTYIYPTDTLHFGSPTDIDHNGRIILMYTGRVNELSTGGEGGFVGGFFFNGDLFPDTNVVSSGDTLYDQCAESNYAEIFYLLAPDPSNHFGGGAHTVDDVRQLTRGTVAHEFQHMINAGNRLYNCPQCLNFEVTWLDEALAHSAEDWVGRAESGFADNQELTFSNISSNAQNYNAFFYQNAARYSIWLQSPSKYGATSTLADTSLGVRGAAWSLVEHTAGQYSGNNIPAFTRALAAGPDTGFRNLELRAGGLGSPHAVSFDTVLAGWAVAAYTSGANVSGLSSVYQFLGYNMRSVQVGVNAGNYPLNVTQTSSGSGAVGGSIDAAGAAYYVMSSSAATFTVHVRGGNGSAAPAADTRVFIVRLQ